MATTKIFPDRQIKSFARLRVYLIRNDAMSPLDGHFGKPITALSAQTHNL